MFRPLRRLFGRKDPVAPVVEEEIEAPEVELETAPKVETENQATRVKTTFLGFDMADDFDDDDDDDDDIVAGISSSEGKTFPTGWVVIIDGPGRGASFALGSGMNGIGRGEDQSICLDFGDTSISREGHLFIAYDEEEEEFLIGHGGKANLARLNGKPLLSTETLSDRDTIKLGGTTCMFIALCSEDFSWADQEEAA